LNAVTQVDAVFSHGGFIWMLQADVVLVLLDPGLDGPAGLLDLYLIIQNIFLFQHVCYNICSLSDEFFSCS
jgi:hypothetical protein